MPAAGNGQYHRRKIAETGKIAVGDLEISPQRAQRTQRFLVEPGERALRGQVT